jgi:peptide/nickel transport system substrate-binding protein
MHKEPVFATRRVPALLGPLFVLLMVMGHAQAQSPKAGSPQVGGTLIFGRGADSVSLDPASVTDGESFNVTDHIFNNLVTFAPGSTELVPDLAESWTVSADNLKYTFSLRKNVTFHDGTSFDAEAVRFAFMRQWDKKHPAYEKGGPYGYFGYVGLDKLLKKITVVNTHQILFDLNRPDATFLAILAMQAFAIPSPTALLAQGKSFGQNPVGTGPFIFKSWQRNDRIVLVRNEKYFGTKALLDSVLFRSIPENSTRLLELLAGNIHVMDNPNPDDIQTIKARMGKKVEVAQKPGMNLAYLAMNNLKKPFDNLKVRQAIRMAINKDAIIQAVYAGMGEPAKNPLPPTIWGYNDKVSHSTYDPVAAKKLLAEAGFPDGFSSKLFAMPVPRPYMPDGRKVAESIQADLAKIGIKIEIVSYEWGTYLEKLDQGEHEMALMGWTADIGDPDNFLYVLLDKDNAKVPASNISFYQSQKVHDLLISAKAERNQEKRAKWYQEAQELIDQDVPMIPLAHSIDTVPHLTAVKNFTIDPTGRRRFSEVWLSR